MNIKRKGVDQGLHLRKSPYSGKYEKGSKKKVNENERGVTKEVRDQKVRWHRSYRNGISIKCEWSNVGKRLKENRSRKETHTFPLSTKEETIEFPIKDQVSLSGLFTGISWGTLRSCLEPHTWRFCFN